MFWLVFIPQGCECKQTESHAHTVPGIEPLSYCWFVTELSIGLKP